MIATNEVADMLLRHHLWIGVSQPITEAFVAGFLGQTSPIRQ
jgi:hypothetical protein